MAIHAFQERAVPLRSERHEITVYFTGQHAWATSDVVEAFRFVVIGAATARGRWAGDTQPRRWAKGWYW